jgi:hypothetical protein
VIFGGGLLQPGRSVQKQAFRRKVEKAIQRDMMSASPRFVLHDKDYNGVFGLCANTIDNDRHLCYKGENLEWKHKLNNKPI